MKSKTWSKSRHNKNARRRKDKKTLLQKRQEDIAAESSWQEHPSYKRTEAGFGTAKI